MNSSGVQHVLHVLYTVHDCIITTQEVIELLPLYRLMYSSCVYAVINPRIIKGPSYNSIRDLYTLEYFLHI